MTHSRNLTDVVMPLESDVDRPLSRRATARVLLADPEGRVLMLEDSDPLAPGTPRFWVTPGGGIDPGETPAQAALREVEEETGLRLTPEALRGPVAERTVVHAYSDKVLIQPETYFVVTVPAFDPEPAGLTDEEVLTLVGYKWWSIAELRASELRVWPVGLADLVAAIGTPSAWPVPLSTAQESTVPADLDHLPL